MSNISLERWTAKGKVLSYKVRIEVVTKICFEGHADGRLFSQFEFVLNSGFHGQCALRKERKEGTDLQLGRK